MQYPKSAYINTIHTILTMFTKIENSIERIFFQLNMDDNGCLISKLLQPVKLQIYKALQSGNELEAVELYTCLLSIMSRCFVDDRHYLYTDKQYMPDIDCSDIYNWMQSYYSQGRFSSHAWHHLENMLNLLRQNISFQEYGIPTVCKITN